MGPTQQNKGDDGELCPAFHPHRLSCTASGGRGSGVPHKGVFQSHWGSILASNPFMLCTSAAEPLATNPDLFTEHTPEVANVMHKQLFSSSVFTGVLSCPPGPPIQSRWLSLVDSRKPLLPLLLCACVESQAATQSRIITVYVFMKGLNYSSGISSLVYLRAPPAPVLLQWLWDPL